MLRISHGTQVKGQMTESNGYGYATANMLKSLQRLGYEVNPNDSSADVEIWFDQPHHWKFSPGVYKIGYHPWESTALLPKQKPDWLEQMNACDEVWTPSPLIADWYRAMGVKRPVYVYLHGVDPVWTPKKRTPDGTFKFLHVGAEAARKGAKEAMQSMRMAFPHGEDVSITMKVISGGRPMALLPRVKYVNDRMSLEQLIQLFHDHHVYVYPSYGEGFGLTPLQALATGMPTITLPAWAPYADFLDPNLNIDSTLTKSPWPVLHPGNMFRPDGDSIIDAMRYAYHNYDAVHADALSQVDDLLEAYNWDTLTGDMFNSLEQRLG